MIIYQTNNPVKYLKIACKRQINSLNPMTLIMFGIFFVLSSSISLLFEGVFLGELSWIVMVSILLTIIFFALFYPLSLKKQFDKLERDIREKNLSENQKDIYKDDGIEFNIFGKISYHDDTYFSSILVLKDVIIIRRNLKNVLHYARHSFTNATEEEWVQFMKTKNPNIKVRRFKSGLFWY